MQLGRRVSGLPWAKKQTLAYGRVDFRGRVGHQTSVTVAWLGLQANHLACPPISAAAERLHAPQNGPDRAEDVSVIRRRSSFTGGNADPHIMLEPPRTGGAAWQGDDPRQCAVKIGHSIAITSPKGTLSPTASQLSTCAAARSRVNGGQERSEWTSGMRTVRRPDCGHCVIAKGAGALPWR